MVHRGASNKPAEELENTLKDWDLFEEGVRLLFGIREFGYRHRADLLAESVECLKKLLDEARSSQRTSRKASRSRPAS
jgi:hypothetical protein